jgi:hypothetical protein
MATPQYILKHGVSFEESASRERVYLERIGMHSRRPVYLWETDVPLKNEDALI